MNYKSELDVFDTKDDKLPDLHIVDTSPLPFDKTIQTRSMLEEQVEEAMELALEMEDGDEKVKYFNHILSKIEELKVDTRHTMWSFVFKDPILGDILRSKHPDLEKSIDDLRSYYGSHNTTLVEVLDPKVSTKHTEQNFDANVSVEDLVSSLPDKEEILDEISKLKSNETILETKITCTIPETKIMVIDHNEGESFIELLQDYDMIFGNLLENGISYGRYRFFKKDMPNKKAVLIDPNTFMPKIVHIGTYELTKTIDGKEKTREIEAQIPGTPEITDIDLVCEFAERKRKNAERKRKNAER